MKRQFLVPRVALRERGDERRCRLVSRSSFPLFVVVVFFFFFRTVVVSVVSFCSSSCASSFPPLLLERAQKREICARAKKSMHVNLEQKRRDVSRVFAVVAVDDVFLLLLLLLRRVSFKRTKDQPTNAKEEALKVFLYIYIYVTRGNESRRV